MAKSPRYYQVEAIEAVQKFWREDRSGRHPLIVAGTGTGKTFMTERLLHEEALAGKRCIWLAHLDELITQPFKDFVREYPHMAPRCGIVKAGRGESYYSQVIFASKQSLIRPKRLRPVLKVGHPDIVVVDEAHYSMSKEYQKLLAELIGPDTRVLGLTATPEAAGKARMSDYWQIVYSYDLLRSIDEGFNLRPYAGIYLPPELDVAKMAMRSTTMDDSWAELARNHIVEWTVNAIQQRHEFESLPLRGDKVSVCLEEIDGAVGVYCTNIQQAEETAEAMNRAGLRTVVFKAGMDSRERDSNFNALREGRVKHFTNCELVTVGTDVPRLQAIVGARAFGSRNLYMQTLGRAVRRFSGQERAYFLDLTGASRVHSIAAAAVLIRGKDCSESIDGRHRFTALADGSGQCVHCGDTVKCVKNKGGHDFRDGSCRHCGAHQCELSPDLQHHFIPWDDGMQACSHCGMEIPDPMAGLLKRRGYEKEDVTWNLMRTGDREVWVAHLLEDGVVFNVPHGNLFRPWWYQDRLMPLAPRPIEAELSRYVTDDIARKARKVNGKIGGYRGKSHHHEQHMDARRIVTNHPEIWEA